MLIGVTNKLFSSHNPKTGANFGRSPFHQCVYSSKLHSPENVSVYLCEKPLSIDTH